MARDHNLLGQYLVLDISETAGQGSVTRLIRRHQITRRVPPSNLDQIIKTFGEHISEFELDESEFSNEDSSTKPTYRSFNEETEQLSDSDNNDSEWDPDPVVVNKGDEDWSDAIDESVEYLSSSDDLHSKVREDMNIDSSNNLDDSSSAEKELLSESERSRKTNKVKFSVNREENTDKILPDFSH
jgi:hypothetical protein